MGLGKGQEQEGCPRQGDGRGIRGRTPPVGVTAAAHAAALAWTPPGFAAFDTGRAGVENAGAEMAADAVAPEAVADAEASAEPDEAAPVEQVEPRSADAPANAPEPVSVGESTKATESVEAGAPTIAVNGDAVVRAANGHDNGDGLDLPEFLRRV